MNDSSKEGLYAVQWKGHKRDEFARLLRDWTDPLFLIEYYETNEEYFNTDYFKQSSQEEVFLQIDREVKIFARKFKEFKTTAHTEEDRTRLLQEMFEPLLNKTTKLAKVEPSKSKALPPKEKPILRLYAVRINVNTFIITGGAIKITQKMEDHPDTAEELKKINQVRAWALSEGLECSDDLKMFIYEP